MVALDQILASNARISKTLPSGLVGVFVGATKGIGLSTVLAFTKHVIKPRIYIVGRSVSDGEALVRKCKEMNSGGDYVFLSKDISLMKNVDAVCDEIKRREKMINLLFCSQGTVKGWTGEPHCSIPALPFPSPTDLYDRDGRRTALPGRPNILLEDTFCDEFATSHPESRGVEDSTICVRSYQRRTA